MNDDIEIIIDEINRIPTRPQKAAAQARIKRAATDLLLECSRNGVRIGSVNQLYDVVNMAIEDIVPSDQTTLL